MHRRRLVTGVRVAAAVVALALAGCACGGSGAKSGGVDRGASPAAPEGTAPLTHFQLKIAQLKRVLDLQSMPTGWKVGVQELAGRDVPMGDECRKPGHVCAGMVSHAIVQYDNAESTGNVHIDMSSFEDVRAAQSWYKGRSVSYAGKGDREVAMPTVGDASVARSGVNDHSGDPFTALVMRVGTVVVAMAYTHRDEADPQMLLALARMESTRLRQVQSGEEPTASLSGF